MVPMLEDPRTAVPSIPARVFERFVFFMLKENSDSVWGPSSDLESMYTAFDEYRSQLAGVIRDGHNKALGEISRPTEREIFFRTLDWTLLPASGHGAVLPDCVVVAIDKHGRASSHMFVGNDPLGAVVMPVTPDKLLVGAKDGFVVPDDFDFNTTAAQFSHSFFLSPRNDEETSRLQSMIGEQLQVTPRSER